MTDTQTPSPEGLAEIQTLIQQGNIPGALSALDALDEHARTSQMGLYMRAVCLRHLRQHADAERTLLRLIEIAPNYGRAFQELGHLYRDTVRNPEAVSAYATACHLNPALKASWLGQFKLLDRARSPERIAQIEERLDWLKNLAAPLLASLDMLHEGKLLKAERLCRNYMQKNPTDVEGMRVLAEIALRLSLIHI